MNWNYFMWQSKLCHKLSLTCFETRITIQIPNWAELCSNSKIFAVRYNYAQGPSLLASEIIFQPQSRRDDVTREVMHLHGLSHQVNPIPVALTFSSLFLCKEQADPSATRPDPALNTSWPLCSVWKEEQHQILMFSSDYSASKWDTTVWLLVIRHLLQYFRVINREVSFFLWLIQR